MKHSLFVAFSMTVLAVIFGAILPHMKPALAVCSLEQGTRQFSNTVSIIDSPQPIPPLAQCKAPGRKPAGTYTVWCDTQTEANAQDSLLAPVCGSSVELEKTNSTCWVCGGVTRCAGVTFARGTTDTFMTANRTPVSPGESTQEAWRVPGGVIPATGFIYNNQHYDKPSGDVIMCNSNLAGCGGGQCTNLVYPEVTTGVSGSAKTENKTIINTIIGNNPGERIAELSEGLDFRIGSRIDDPADANIKYADNQVDVTDLRAFGAHFDQMYSQYYMPGIIQATQFSRPTDGGKGDATLPLQSGYRFCAPNGDISIPGGTADNVPLVGLNSTKGSIDSTETDPRYRDYYHNLLWGSRYASAIYVPGATIPGANFYTPRADLVTIKNSVQLGDDVFLEAENVGDLNAVLYGCEADAESESLRTTTVGAEGVATLTGPGSWFTGTIGYLIDKIGGLFKCSEEDTSPRCASKNEFIRPTDGLAGLVALNCQGIGCTPDEIHQNVPEADRVALAQSGGSDTTRNGLFSIYKVGPIKDYPLTNAKVEIDQTVNGATANDRQVNLRGLKGVVDAYNCAKELLTPHNLQTTLGTSCPLLGDVLDPQEQQDRDNRRLVCNAELPSALAAPEKDRTPGNGAPNPLTYTIAHRNTSCKLPSGINEFQCNIIRKMQDVYPDYYLEGGLNLEEHWDLVQTEVSKFANPAFALALWIEETAASGVPKEKSFGGFGCISRPAGGDRAAIVQQIDCLRGVMEATGDDFQAFMCRWSGEERDRTTNHCTSFVRNSEFIHNLKFWYEIISQDLPAGCQVQ